MDESLFGILPIEMILEIFDRMSIVDCMSFKFTCKYLYQININFIKKINLMLQEYFPYEIIESIKKNNIAITGSLLLKIIYGATWKPNDIDLYIENTHGQDTKNFIDAMEKNNFECEFESEDCTCQYIESYYFESKKYPLKVNLICLNYVDPLKYINLVADMEIGKVVVYNDKLHIKNWDKLINRTDYIVPLSLIASKLYYQYKLGKYENKRSLRRMYSRQQKYTDRGFKIVVPKNINTIMEKLKMDYVNYKTDLKNSKISFDKDTVLSTYLDKYHTDTNVFINEAMLIEKLDLLTDK